MATARQRSVANLFAAYSSFPIPPISKQDQLGMITIGLSAATGQSTPEPKPVNWKKRIVSLWIPAVLGLGLLMAFGYVGVRIVAGKSQAPSTPAPVKTEAAVVAGNVPPAPAPPPALAPKPAPAPRPVVDAAPFTIITPQPGERFLQVAAVSPHMVLTYIDTLRQSNLEAIVAPGPTPDLLRILVGPFADHDSMEKAKAQLRSSGRSPIVRSY